MARSFRGGAIAPPITARRQSFTHTVPVPPIVNATYWVILAGAGLNVVAVAAQLVETHGMTTMAFATLFGTALRVIFAIYYRRGYKQVRAYLTFVSLLSALALLVPLDPFSYPTVLSGVAIVVLAWLPASNRYFNAVAAARKAYESRQLSKPRGLQID